MCRSCDVIFTSQRRHVKITSLKALYQFVGTPLPRTPFLLFLSFPLLLFSFFPQTLFLSSIINHPPSSIHHFHSQIHHHNPPFPGKHSNFTCSCQFFILFFVKI